MSTYQVAPNPAQRSVAVEHADVQFGDKKAKRVETIDYMKSALWFVDEEGDSAASLISDIEESGWLSALIYTFWRL